MVKDLMCEGISAIYIRPDPHWIYSSNLYISHEGFHVLNFLLPFKKTCKLLGIYCYSTWSPWIKAR